MMGEDGRYGIHERGEGEGLETRYDSQHTRDTNEGCFVGFVQHMTREARMWARARAQRALLHEFVCFLEDAGTMSAASLRIHVGWKETMTSSGDVYYLRGTNNDGILSRYK
jgi:hypothetical protein